MRQVEHLYLAVPRDEHGYPTYLAKFGTLRSARELHNYACFLLGINESATVERLWAEQQSGPRCSEGG